MDLSLSEEHRMLRDLARSFVDRELLPLENQLGPAHGPIPPEVMSGLQDKARSLGLWMLDVPEADGGAGLDLLARCLIAEQVGRTTVIPWHGHRLFGPEMRPVLHHLNDDQRRRFLAPLLRGELRICFAQTEPDAGTDPAGMRTRAVRDGDDYVITGAKRFITEAGEADVAQLLAVTEPGRGAKGGITCFLVDLQSPGVTRAPMWPIITGERLWQITLDGVRVPVANVVGEPGEGFAIGQRWATEGRIKSHGARSLGAAQRAYELMVAYSRQRVTFGQPLSERQAVQFMIADSAMELHTTRLLVYECAWRADRAEDVRDLSYMVKIVATEVASRVVDRAIQVHGGMGVSAVLPLEHWARYLRPVRVNEGATEVLRWRLARNLLRGSRPGSA
jgi:acyl-CoA dehydrogenase